MGQINCQPVTYKIGPLLWKWGNWQNMPSFGVCSGDNGITPHKSRAILQRKFANSANLISIVAGHKDGRVSRMHLREHVISQLLYDAGVSRKSFRLRLGIKSPQYYNKCMTNPCEHLSINQLTMVADVLDMKLLEVLGIVMGKKHTAAHKWYDSNPEAF